MLRKHVLFEKAQTREELGMNHIAIDLGGIKSQVCKCSANGEILAEQSINTAELGIFFRSEPPSRVVMETCAESHYVANQAIKAGHSVGIVPATLVRELGVGYRGIKTDIRDARALSAASCRVENLPTVHIRSASARDRLVRIGMRHNLVTARTQLVNAVRGFLRGQLVKVRGEPENFPKNVRKALESSPDGLPSHVDALLICIETLSEQISAATKEIAALASSDAICKRLQSIPGIGPMTSLTFASVVDDVSRFPNASALESYLGLTPGENSSSGRVHRTSITKAGPSTLRQYLTQAALCLRRLRPEDPMALWAQDIAIRRGKHVATIALARKLAGVMYAMCRDSTIYKPDLAAQMK
jgi:transposase